MLDQAFNHGDLEGILSLYDDAAVVLPMPGVQARGMPEIRALYKRFLRPGVTAHQEKMHVLEADGIALFTSRWTLHAEGQPSEIFIATVVLRQQADGGWKALIDSARGPSVLDAN
jgi:ketosteroid isomerase-like protein